MNDTEILKKFAELKKISKEISKLKNLYHKHDSIMTELLPLFVKKNGKKIVINTEIVIAGEMFVLTPKFYEKELTAKNWKSTAIENFSLNF